MLITLHYVLAFCSSLSAFPGEAGRLICLDKIKAKDSQYKRKANKLSKGGKQCLIFLSATFAHIYASYLVSSSIKLRPVNPGTDNLMVFCCSARVIDPSVLSSNFDYSVQVIHRTDF